MTNIVIDNPVTRQRETLTQSQFNSYMAQTNGDVLDWIVDPVLKHGTHDQKDHGNWATGSQGSVSELADNEIQDIIHNTKTIEEMYQKVAESLGKTLKPKVAVIPEGEENLYRGLSNLERDSQQLLDGKIPFTPFQTWGQGIYATPSKQEAESYGQVVRLKLDDSAKILRTESEAFPVDTTSIPFKSDFIDFPRLLPKITSGEIDNFSISDAYNIYWAAKGYDGYQPHGGEIVLFNGTHLTVNKTDIGSAVKKHQEHDQSSHGSWATGELSGEQKTVVSAWTSLSNKSSWRQIANDLSEGKTPNASENDIKTVKTLVDAIKQNGVIPTEALGRAELLTTGLRWQGALPKVGDTLKNELSSATLDEKTSERFSQYSDFGGSKGKPVIFHYGMQTKGLDVNRAGADAFADEQEWLVSGTFKITDRYSENGITHLNLKPVEAVKKHGNHDQKTHGNWAGTGYPVAHHERLKPTENTVSPDETEAVRDYINSGYLFINGFLRKRDLMGEADLKIQSEKQGKKIELLDSVFAKVPPSEKETIVYRGLSGVIAEQLKNSPVGSTFVDKGFVSTTRMFEIAENFTTISNQNDKKAVLSITVPAGTKSLGVSRFFRGDTRAAVELETILPRGLKFEITSIEEKVIQAKVVPNE